MNSIEFLLSNGLLAEGFTQFIITLNPGKFTEEKVQLTELMNEYADIRIKDELQDRHRLRQDDIIMALHGYLPSDKSVGASFFMGKTIYFNEKENAYMSRYSLNERDSNCDLSERGLWCFYSEDLSVLEYRSEVNPFNEERNENSLQGA